MSGNSRPKRRSATIDPRTQSVSLRDRHTLRAMIDRDLPDAPESFRAEVSRIATLSAPEAYRYVDAAARREDVPTETAARAREIIRSFSSAPA